MALALHYQKASMNPKRTPPYNTLSARRNQTPRAFPTEKEQGGKIKCFGFSNYDGIPISSAAQICAADIQLLTFIDRIIESGELNNLVGPLKIRESKRQYYGHVENARLRSAKTLTF
jgi:hypothetical protein